METWIIFCEHLSGSYSSKSTNSKLIEELGNKDLLLKIKLISYAISSLPGGQWEIGMEGKGAGIQLTLANKGTL
jgi:hypothetical protein